ncbi:MAG: hypothetical protein ABI887_22115 [Burkholderiales bacterium]
MTSLTPHSAAPTLQDFEPLLLAELILLRAAANGSIAKIGYQRPRNATPDVCLRAEFLAFLARGGGAGAPVAGGRLQLLGACIVGRLDLSRCRVPVSLWMYRCVLAVAPQFDGAQVTGSLSFPDSALPGLNAEAARIDGELAFNAGCSVHGELNLARARIGRDLNCERMHLQASSKFANTLPCRLVADGVQIGGDVILSGGVDATGALSFDSARIHGDLRASGAHVSAELDAGGSRGAALNLDRARIGGDVLLGAGFSAAGQVRLLRTRIGGDLDCRGADFDAIGDAGWGDAAAVLLDRAQIGGVLNLQQLQRPLEGSSLIDTRAGTLLDDAQTWGAHHTLDGFSYARFGATAPTDATMRLGWLATQRAGHFGNEFRPEPWQRVIKVLRRMGRDDHATEVAIGRERHLRRSGLIGRDAPAALRWLPRLGHALFGAFAGYGHRPLRVLIGACVLWLACAGVYWTADENGLMAPTQPQPKSARGAVHLQALAYSLDVLLPLIDLRQQRRWAPAVADDKLTSPAALVQALSWFEAACGWLATLTLLAIATGLTDRDRRA